MGKSHESRKKPVESDYDDDDDEGENNQGVSLPPLVARMEGNHGYSEEEWSGSEEDNEDDYSDDDYGHESLVQYNPAEYSLEDTIEYAVELAMRDEEDVLIENALEKIRRAHEHGNANFKLTKREIAALGRKRHRDLIEESSRAKARAAGGQKDALLKRSPKLSSGTSRNRSSSDTTSVAETVFSNPSLAFPGYYIFPASPGPGHPGHMSVKDQPTQSPTPQSSSPSKFQPQMVPTQSQFYHPSQHSWIVPASNAPGTIPFSVPQSPFPMYPRPAYPAPSNVMCQPVSKSVIPIGQTSASSSISRKPTSSTHTRDLSGSSSSDCGVKLNNDRANSKKSILTRRRKAPTRTSSKAISSNTADTPTPTSDLDTSKSSSSKLSTSRSGFTRPKKKKFRWV